MPEFVLKSRSLMTKSRSPKNNNEFNSMKLLNGAPTGNKVGIEIMATYGTLLQEQIELQLQVAISE
eukprot:5912231-Amphidinium_carterae.1